MKGGRMAATVSQAPGPLPAPEGWSASERRLIAQLNAILADIYRRWGRLEAKDLSQTLRQAFDRKVTAEDFESVFLQTARALSVQFGTPEALKGETLELSPERLYAKVRAVRFELTDNAGAVAGTVRAEGDRLKVGVLEAADVACDRLLRRNQAHETLMTEDKTVLGAINELKRAVDGLSARLGQEEGA